MVPGVTFRYEKMIDNIIDFGQGVSLKIVADLGFKDKDGNKGPVYAEYEYPSAKYKNEDHLITAKRNVRYYLRFDYPNLDDTSQMKTNAVIINPYAVIPFQKAVKKFDDIAMDPYMTTSKGELSINVSKTKSVITRPVKGSSIVFSHEIYEARDGSKDYGVKIMFNDTYFIVVRTLTTWKSFVYFIMKCDLYLWGSVLVTPITTSMVGQNVSSVNGIFGNKKLEVTYEPDPDTLAAEKNSSSMKAGKSKPLTKEDRKKSFFSD